MRLTLLFVISLTLMAYMVSQHAKTLDFFGFFL